MPSFSTLIGGLGIASLALISVIALVTMGIACMGFIIEEQTKGIRNLILERQRLRFENEAKTLSEKGLVRLCRTCMEFPCSCPKAYAS